MAHDELEVLSEVGDVVRRAFSQLPHLHQIDWQFDVRDGERYIVFSLGKKDIMSKNVLDILISPDDIVTELDKFLRETATKSVIDAAGG